jgi:hypothetical protein
MCINHSWAWNFILGYETFYLGSTFVNENHTWVCICEWKFILVHTYVCRYLFSYLGMKIYFWVWKFIFEYENSYLWKNWLFIHYETPVCDFLLSPNFREIYSADFGWLGLTAGCFVDRSFMLINDRWLIDWLTGNFMLNDRWVIMYSIFFSLL